MRKAYETPMVEKIAFRYRDQVVAASGAPSGLIGDNPTTGEQIIARILEGLGYSTCKGYECTSLADYWA